MSTAVEVGGSRQMELANCPRCGRLFTRHFRDICQNCFADIEKEYELCLEYLKKHKGATITVLSEETGVSIRQITKFIKEGRISLYNAPNLSYPCEVCGVLIREGNMCENCRGRLNTEVRKATSGRDLADSQQRSKGAYQIGDRLRERE